MSKKGKYTFIDLFAGCGGLSKGYEMAGYDAVLGVDCNMSVFEILFKNN